MELRQYQIVLVNLDPTIAGEIKKTRRCVIISPDEMNRFSQTIVVAPMTSNSKPYPTRVRSFHHNRIGSVVIDQIQTIDKRRIVKVLDHLLEKEVNQIKLVIKETYVD